MKVPSATPAMTDSGGKPGIAITIMFPLPCIIKKIKTTSDMRLRRVIAIKMTPTGPLSRTTTTKFPPSNSILCIWDGKGFSLLWSIFPRFVPACVW